MSYLCICVIFSLTSHTVKHFVASPALRTRIRPQKLRCVRLFYYFISAGFNRFFFFYSRWTVGWVCKLLPLRIPRVYEEPGALPDHRGQGWNQRHQVRADPRLFTVQVPCGHRARVRLRRLDARTVWLPQPAALFSGAPKPQSLWLRVSAESTGTLLLAQLGPQPGHLVPNSAALCAHTAARWILVTGAGTRSPLFQLHRSHARKHV